MAKREMAVIKDEALAHLQLMNKYYESDVIVDSPEEIQRAIGIDAKTWRATREKLVNLGKIKLIANPKSKAYAAILILDSDVPLNESGWHLCWYKDAKGNKATGYHNLHDVDVPCVKAPGTEAFPPFKKGANSSTLTDPGQPIKSNSTGSTGRSRAIPEPPTEPTSTDPQISFLKHMPTIKEVKLVGTVYRELPNGQMQLFAVDDEGNLWHPKPDGEKNQFHKSGPDDSDTIEKYWNLIRQPMTAATRHDLGLKKKKKFNTAEPAETMKGRHTQEVVLEEFWYNPTTRQYFDDYGVLQGQDHPVWVYILMAIPGLIMYVFTALRVKVSNWYQDYSSDMKAKRSYRRVVDANKRAREKEEKYLGRKGKRIYGDYYALQEDKRPVRRVVEQRN